MKKLFKKSCFQIPQLIRFEAFSMNPRKNHPRQVMNIILISSQRNPLSIKIEKIAFRKKKKVSFYFLAVLHTSTLARMHVLKKLEAMLEQKREFLNCFPTAEKEFILQFK